MAVAFRNSTHTAYGSTGVGTTTTVNVPSGTQDGDLIIILFVTGHNPAQAASVNGFNTATGFPHTVGDSTTHNWYARIYCWWKIAAGEGASYSVTSAASTNTQAWCGAYSGTDQTTPLNPNPTIGNGSSTTSTAPGLTTAVNDSLIIFWDHDWGDNQSTLTPPTGTTPTFTERLDVAGTEVSVLYVAEGPIATASTSTGDKSQGNNCYVADLWHAGLIAVVPSSATTKALADSGVAGDAITGQLITFAGPNYGSSTASISGIDPTDWVNPGNVYADDTSYATWSP